LKLAWRTIYNQLCCLNQLHILDSFYNYLVFTSTKSDILSKYFLTTNNKGERLFLPDTEDIGVS
jgi:hypothetical protein